MPHSFILSEALLPQHSQCFSNVASEPLSLQDKETTASLHHRRRVFAFAGQKAIALLEHRQRALPLYIQGLIKALPSIWMIGGIRFHVELVPHPFILSEALLPQHSQCFSNVASEPLSLQGDGRNALLNHRKGAFPSPVQGLIKAPPSIWMIGAFRSSGRARTYNPSVNSRMLCH